jgi:hypothetical protein
MKTKLTIGRRELIHFPELGLMDIIAKIDTGAYTTVLHCHDIREVNGVLHFKLLDPSHPEYSNQEKKAEVYYKKEFKNSFGECEKRYVINSLILIGKRKIRSLISLTDRANMRYPVLIGRRLLKNKFLVDVALLNNLK